jgi:hypothetical protein
MSLIILPNPLSREVPVFNDATAATGAKSHVGQTRYRAECVLNCTTFVAGCAISRRACS